jgi:hypothetical protein
MLYQAAILLIVIINIKIDRGKYAKRNCIILSIFGAIISTIYFFQTNSMGYANVFLPEQILAGFAHTDTLFHLSISSMLSNYGKLSTGLDGLVPIRYHALSHLWFGVIAKEANISVANGYYLAKLIVALPLLMFGLSVASLAFMRRNRSLKTSALVISIPIALLSVIEIFDWMSYLVSESYMIGLLLFMIGMPYLSALARDKTKVSEQSIFITFGFGGLILGAKVSLGAIWMLAIAIIIVLKRTNIRCYLLAACMLLLQLYVVNNYIIAPSNGAEAASIYPFHFFLNYPMVALVNLSVIAVAAYLHINDLAQENNDAWSIVVLAMFLASLAPVLLLRIEGGSGYYFINVGSWIGIASLSGRIISWIDDRHAQISFMIAVTIVTVCNLLHADKMMSWKRLGSQINALYTHLIPDTSELPNPGLFNTDSLSSLARASSQSVGGKISDLFKKAGVGPGSHTLVSVRPEFSEYWKLPPSCVAGPFLVPAAFGLPMLKGLPPLDLNCRLQFYNYSHYSAGSNAEALSDESLCRLSAEKGFNDILLLKSVDSMRIVKCEK